MTFLRNTWYAAAWSDEVQVGTMLARSFLGEPVLLFRRSDGQINAITDRCPHRFAPLSLGKLKGNIVECPYHGLQFDGSGRCVHNPQGNGQIPAAAAVTSYPLAEQQGVIWIWMGSASEAHTTPPPRFDGLDEAEYTLNRGAIKVCAHYELVVDNLMDSSHIIYLHPDLGSEAVARSKTTLHQDGDTIRFDRFVPKEQLPKFLNMVYEMNGELADRWIEICWRPPALIELGIAIAPHGTPREAARLRPTTHLITPESEMTTHYFWASGRNFRRDDQALHNLLQVGLARAFEAEDQPMIEAQQRRIGQANLLSLLPVTLADDVAALRSRRTLRRLLAAEQSLAGTEPMLMDAD